MLGALGFDWSALLFQVINFLILLTILRLVAYKPILRVLENRRRKIEESLATSKEVEQLKVSLQAEQQKLLREAQKTIEQAIAGGRLQAAEIIKKAEATASERAEQILERAHERATHDLEQLKAEFKNETIQLIATATEKILRQKIDAKQDEALIKAALEL